MTFVMFCRLITRPCISGMCAMWLPAQVNRQLDMIHPIYELIEPRVRYGTMNTWIYRRLIRLSQVGVVHPDRFFLPGNVIAHERVGSFVFGFGRQC